jgi:sulfoxide reductase heme-binding subunit YedZ
MVLLERLKSDALRIVVHVAAWVPMAWMVWHYSQGLFIVDPVREMTTVSGRTALILLMLCLACTPINTLLGWKQVLRVRRALGVYSFMYASLHFLVFIGLDYRLDFALIQQAIFDQRYVVAGFAAGLILLALALTSTSGWKQRLGRNWKRLHSLVYAAGILAVIHYLWLVKDPKAPQRYALLLAVLLLLRIPWVRRKIVRTRRRLLAGWQQRLGEVA